jgi:hypothetical protein
MSSTKSSGAGIAFSTSLPDRLAHAAAGPLNAGDCLSPVFGVQPDHGLQPGSAGPCPPSLDDLSPEDFREIDVFEEFLDDHVKENAICDVQCMLLWSEWVRTFRRKNSGFPRLIREKEFRSAVTDTFGVGIMTDGGRGPVYAGLKFVP